MIWTSAAAAELYPLISSCSLATAVYSTLIKMVLLMILDSRMRKKKTRCFASSVKMLQHHILVNDLLEAILHWSKLAIRKWSAHIWNDPVSQENVMADFVLQQATVSSSSMVRGLSIQVHTLFYMRWHVSCMDQWISKRGDKWSFLLSMVCTNASHKSYTWWMLFDTQTDDKI